MIAALFLALQSPAATTSAPNAAGATATSPAPASPVTANPVPSADGAVAAPASPSGISEASRVQPLVISFVGGNVSLDLAAVLDRLSRSPGLLPTQAVTLAKGQGPCLALRQQGVPVACIKLIPLLSRLNPTLNVKGALPIGARVNLPKVHVEVRRLARSYDPTDPKQLQGARQITQGWTTKNLAPTQIGGLTRIEFDTYDLSIDYPDTKTAQKAAETIADLGSRNVIVPTNLDAAMKVAPFSNFPDHYQNDCQPGRHDLPVHDYMELLESDPGLTALLSHAPPPAIKPTVYIIDTSVIANPALAGAIAGIAPPAAPAPTWICQWSGFNPTEHATHMAGIVAARNGQGFKGLAPNSQITSIVWLRPDAPGSETLIRNMTVHDLGLRISEIDGSDAAPYSVFLLASELDPYPKSDQDGDGELASPENRTHYSPNLTIHDERPLFIVSAGQGADAHAAVRLSEVSLHSPQNFGSWENVVVVTACSVCTHDGWGLLPGAYYGSGQYPVVHLAAPGGTPIPGWIDTDRVGEASGTSQAAAFVAGVAANMIAHYPNQYNTAVAVKMRLQVTAWPMVGTDASGQAVNQKLAAGIVDAQRAQLDPTQDWVSSIGGWVHGHIKGWSSKTLTVTTPDGASTDVSTARLLRLVRLHPGTDDPSVAIYTDNPPSLAAPYRGVVNKLGPVTLADQAITIQFCDRGPVQLGDTYDVIARTVGRSTDGTCN